MNPAIQTSRLTFRDFTVDDYDAVHAYGSDPVVTRYTAFGPNTPEQTKGLLQFVSGEPSQEDRANYNFALIHKQTNKLTGSCGLMKSNPSGPQYSFGYVLHKDWWGQGYEGCQLKAFFIRDTWFDLQTFAMLRSEWQKRVG